MFRILGFLIGSATSIAIILLVMGMPEFQSRDSVIDQQRFDAAVEKLMAKKQDTEAIATEPGENPVSDGASSMTTAEKPMAESQHEAETTEPPFVESDFAAHSDSPPLLNELQWYSFWNPFRSEIAANGFVSQLERVTGIDYRVVKIKPGAYEVAFAYDDDAERHTKLAQISAATGLELPGS